MSGQATSISAAAGPVSAALDAASGPLGAATDAPKAPRARKPRKAKPPTAQARSKPVAAAADRGPVDVWMEAYGIALLAVATVFFLCLASYDPSDVQPSGLAARSGHTLNLVGPVGAHLADLALTAFGGASFVLACALAFAGGAFLLRRSFPVKLRAAAGFVLIVLTLSAFLQLAVQSPLLSHAPGGAVGEITGEVLRSLMSTIGSYIVVFSTFCLSLVLVVDLSIGDLLRGLGGAAGRGATVAGRRARAEASALIEQRRESVAARRRVQEARRAVVEADAETSPPDTPLAWTFGEDAGLADPDAESVLWSFEHELDVAHVPLSLDPPDGFISAPEVSREALDAGWDLPTAEPSAPRPAPPGAELLEVEVGSDELVIVESLPRKRLRDRPVQRPLYPAGDQGEFELPPMSLLDYDDPDRVPVDRAALQTLGGKLKQALSNYKVQGDVRQAHPGPVVTMFEFKPAAGTKLSSIAGRYAELAMELSAKAVRIVAPIPGKDVVGIEVPSARRETVFLKEVVADEVFADPKKLLPLCLGKDIFGNPVVTDLAKMPHLLVAGTTGSGKSVAVNCMILSLLYRYGPDDLKLLLVDPKQLEFNIYEGIPHLLSPVVTDPRHAAGALRWAVDEMERRYELMATTGVRNIVDFNKRWAGKPLDPEAPPESAASEPLERLPFLVVILDEFADLMMVASKDVETAVCRLAQKARAAGIHLILATQRPSTDVITGVIKANFPGRVGMTVQSMHDSRTIIGTPGCEHLLGYGDMLVMAPGSSDLQRVHGPLVTDVEIRRVVAHLRDQRPPAYDHRVLENYASAGDDGGGASSGGAGGGGGQGELGDDYDPVYDQAVELVCRRRVASASMIQRNLRVGYNRASRIVDQMEADGVVGPADGARPREVLAPPPPEM